jgi:glutamine amidotransferase
MGWNSLRMRQQSPLLSGVGDGAFVYFVHSYAAFAVPDEALVASCDYGGPMAAVVHQGSVFGTQFHPEKSGADGLRIYANFVALCGVAV